MLDFIHFKNAFSIVSITIGIIGSLCSIYSAISPCSAWWVFLIIVGAAILAIVIYQILSYYKVNVKIGKINVTIKRQDLFDTPENSLTIIPVNDYFDTQVDDNVIMGSTIHGQFVNKFHMLFPKEKLDNLIKTAIAKENLKEKNTTLNRNDLSDNNHEKSYPLNSAICLSVGQRDYVLVVASEFDENNGIIPQQENHADLIINTLKYVSKVGNGKPVYMPIIGSGRTNYPISKQEMLNQILHNMVLASPLCMSNGLTICVKKDDNDIDLLKVKEIN